MAIKKLVSATKTAPAKAVKAPKAKAEKAPKAPRLKGKAFVFYAKGEAAALVEKEKAKGNFSERILKGAFGIEFSAE